MDDTTIVSLYWQRNETAINETQLKYGKYIFSIANGILHSTQDAQECENDTYLALWNSIPPGRPDVLSAFIGKIVRRISINKWKSNTAQKRGGGEIELTLEELGDCISNKYSIDAEIEAEMLSRSVDSFLRALPKTERQIFMRRYWYMDSINDIALRFKLSSGKIKMTLMRTRKKLKIFLEKENVFI